MKKLVIISVIALLTAGWSIARAQEFPQEYLGLPGDNLNLYAVMKLFQESETLEAFERNLNDESTRINNLDLNGDNKVDYLMVMDYPDGNIHTIVLRAALGRNETQDVAVFTVKQFNDGTVAIQLIGDEALYGRNYIIEPYYADNGETPNPGYVGNAVPNNRPAKVVKTTTYEVAYWPVVRYIYRPSYVVWRSAWHWDAYPVYWSPWRPIYWHAYYGYHYNWHTHYYSYYRPWNHYRVPHYHNVYYTSVRTYSPTVVVNINKGNYRYTYSKPETRREGERLYQRAHASGNNRSARNVTVSERARVSASSVQRSAVSTPSASERRGSSAVSTRSATRSGTEVRSDAARRTPSGVSERSTNGNSVNRSSVDARKSATVPSQRENVNSSSRRETTVAPRQQSAPAATRTSPPSAVHTAPPAASGRTQVAPKSGEIAPRTEAAPRREAASPAVRQNTQTRTYTPSTSRTTSPAARQSAPQRPSSSVSAPRSQPAPKSGSVSTPARQSQPAVSSSPRSSGRSETPASSGDSNSRSSRESRSGRR